MRNRCSPAPHGRRFSFRPGLQTSSRGPRRNRRRCAEHLLVARTPGVNRPDKKAVSRYLQQRFGTGLPILQIPAKRSVFTPLHAPSDAPTEPAKPTPVAGGIRRWKNRWLISGNRCCLAPWQASRLFELGGDSLMATRMVAQLNRRGIARANLQDIVQPFDAERLLRPSTGGYVRRGQPDTPLPGRR